MIKKYSDFIYKLIIFIFLILNFFLLARVLGYVYLPGETTPLEKALQGAQTVIQYSEDLAMSYGVAEGRLVKDVLAKFKYEIEKANNFEDVASLMVDYGRQVQDIIFREVQNKRINEILNLINSQELTGCGNITISNIDGNIKIVDPHSILNKNTIEMLKQLTFNQTIEVKVLEHRASLLTDGGIFNQVDYLQTKIASLERELKTVEQKAGYKSITGPGIVIEVYDQKGKLEETGIVHDTDIRDIINELWIAGAMGIEVGGQRLTVSSPIRCVGPTMLVNNKPISVNPIIIKTVGEADVLESSLDIIKKQLFSFGIELNINKSEEIYLKSNSDKI
jgi:hypothetical protein